MYKLKIYLVEDHSLLIDGITTVINQEPDLEICGTSSTISEAYTGIGRCHPRLVILDIELSNQESGYSLLKRIRSDYPDISVMMLSMHEEIEYVNRALHMGARGYMLKGQSSDEFVTAVRSVLKNEMYVAPALTGKLLNRMYRSEEDGEDPVRSLTDREFEIFKLLGKGFEMKKISETLGINSSTAETHRQKIKTKLNIVSNNDLIRRAVKWDLENSG